MGALASASEPSLAAGGTRVAFTLPAGARGRSASPPPGRAPIRPSPADGRRVAFTSDAHALSPAECNTARGIFVRDLEARTTVLVSCEDGENRYSGPTKGSSTGADLLVSLRCT